MDTLLTARAHLINSGDIPLVWTQRQPEPEEAVELFRILLSIEANPRKMATILIGAIIKADKERGGATFREDNPVSFFALQQYGKNGFVTQEELESFQRSCK